MNNGSLDQVINKLNTESVTSLTDRWNNTNQYIVINYIDFYYIQTCFTLFQAYLSIDLLHHFHYIFTWLDMYNFWQNIAIDTMVFLWDDNLLHCYKMLKLEGTSQLMNNFQVLNFWNMVFGHF